MNEDVKEKICARKVNKPLQGLGPGSEYQGYASIARCGKIVDGISLIQKSGFQNVAMEDGNKKNL